MKPFRRHVAVAIDGGGMRGLIVTRALTILEQALGFPCIDVFSQSAADQQVHLVRKFYPTLDFRRFQVDLHAPIAMDNTSQTKALLIYGTKMGRMILNDQVDPSQGIIIKRATNRPEIFYG